MAFLGFRAWGTPVRPSLLRPQPTLRLTHFALHQIMKPLWPFLAAGTLTFYLVSKAQDMGVRGASASSVRCDPSADDAFSCRPQPRTTRTIRATRTAHKSQRRRLLRTTRMFSLSSCVETTNRLAPASLPVSLGSIAFCCK